mgnify:CR=1 FL=1
MHAVLDTIAEAIGRSRSALKQANRRPGRRAALQSFIALVVAGTAYGLYRGTRIRIADRLAGTDLGFDNLPMNKLMLQRTGLLDPLPVELVEYEDRDLDLQEQDPSLAFVDKASGEDLDSMLSYLLDPAQPPTEFAAALTSPTPPVIPTLTTPAAEAAAATGGTGVSAASMVMPPSLRESLPTTLPAPPVIPQMPAQRGAAGIPGHVALNDLPPQTPELPPGRRLTSPDGGTQLASLSPVDTPLHLDRANAQEKTLSIVSTHTGEFLRARFVSGGRYDAGALADLSHLLRDHRNGQVRDIDRALFDAAYEVAMRATGSDRGVLHLVSGYRSPETNRLLRERSSGVAKNSYHVRGRAMDFFVDGAEIRDVYVAALKSGAGGVGYYPSSNFVHIDTGPSRSWPAQYKPFASQYRA